MPQPAPPPLICLGDSLVLATVVAFAQETRQPYMAALRRLQQLEIPVSPAADGQLRFSLYQLEETLWPHFHQPQQRTPADKLLAQDRYSARTRSALRRRLQEAAAEVQRLLPRRSLQRNLKSRRCASSAPASSGTSCSASDSPAAAK